jgi:hypothetical protein
MAKSRIDATASRIWEEVCKRWNSIWIEQWGI